MNRQPNQRWQLRLQRYVRYLLVGLTIALLGWAVASAEVVAQTTDQPPADEAPSEPQQPQDLLPDNPLTRPLRNLAPPEVRSIFRDQDIETEVATVYLDGRAVFQVAAPYEDGLLTAANRASQIEQRLELIARDFTDPGSLDDLDVSVSIDEESNQPVIYVNGQPLMSVTYLDARLTASNSPTGRAAQIVQDVETAIQRFNEERQADFLWRQLRWVTAVILITLLASLAIAQFARKAERRRSRLQQSQQQWTASPDPEAAGTFNHVNTIRTTLLTRQKISSLKILKQFLRLLQIFLWVASGLFLLGLFPYTRWLQPLLVNILRLPIRFFLIALGAYMLIRFSSIWIDRLFIAFQTRTAETIERSQRLVLRISTFSQVIKGIVAFVIAGIAFLIMLSMLGVRVGPLLAGAGLLGFAVSFASQSLIKDIINGFLVLLEDQYGVGDVITVKGMSGFVETMNLRITQLRSTDGQLITIPNGQIDIVQNLSKDWSRVDLMIPVGLDADIDQALHLVENIANDLRQDEIWSALILEPPLLLGVDELSHAGATIRIWIKTLPMKQWDVAREYRRRLKLAFEAAEIPIGVPQQVIYVSGAPGPSGGMLPNDSRGTNGAGATSESSDSSPLGQH